MEHCSRVRAMSKWQSRSYNELSKMECNALSQHVLLSISCSLYSLLRTEGCRHECRAQTSVQFVSEIPATFYANLVPRPEVQRALGLLCGYEVVSPKKAECIWPAGVVFERRNVSAKLYIPATRVHLMMSTRKHRRDVHRSRVNNFWHHSTWPTQ